VTGRCRTPLGLLVALAVTGAAVAALPASAPAAPGAAARSVDVLAFEPVSSPVLRALRNRLGRRMNVRRATPSRLRHPRRYEALVVDGQSSTPRELKRRAGRLQRFLDAGASVIAFDVGSAHHRRALYDLTGFRAVPTRGEHFSRVALYRRVVAHGVPRLTLIDARRFLPLGGARLPAKGRRLARRQEARRLAAIVGREVLGAKHPLTPRRARGPAAGAQATDTLPPEVQHLSLSATFPGSAVTPRPALAANGGRCTCPNFPQPIYAPRVSAQTTSWSLTHTVDVYLDNGTDSGGDFQLVSYSVDGEFKPTTGRFAVMDDPFHWNGFFGQNQDFILERAWWTGFADISVTPSSETSARLAIQSHSPTGEPVTSYVAGEQFSLAYRLSRPRGPGVATNIGVGRAQSHPIPDWAVLDQTTAGAPKWEFSARNSCDVRPAGYSEGGCFDLSFGSAATPNEPNNLSRSTLELHGSSHWQTTSLLGDSSSGTLNFTTSFLATLADTYCTSWGVAACSGHELTRWPDPGCTWCNPQPGPESHNLQIDASAVVPVGIESLSFDDPKPNGSKGQHVKATVTLKKASQLPGGTNVVIYSDSRNAVVGALIQGGPDSRTTVVIPKGQASATFDIATNDAGIAPKPTATANITAFYAQPTRGQLTVGSTKGS